ncbi:winged helix-turn-helix domain-containing protein [Paenibacillus tarimensis]
MSSIPPYRDFVFPFLQILNDGELYTTDGIINKLVILFGLLEEDMKEMVKCGRQYTYKNRIINVRTSLLRNGYIQYDGEKNIFITGKGSEFLKSQAFN